MTARVYVPLALEAVDRLDVELERIHARVSGIDNQNASSETLAIWPSLRRARAVVRGIRDHVLAIHGGYQSEAARASSLRARSVIVAIQLSKLDRAAATLSQRPPGRLADVAAFRHYVTEHIGRINAGWSAAAARAHKYGVDVDPSVLDRAEAGYVALGRDLDVIEFLEWGCESEVLGIRASCHVLAAALDVALPDSKDEGTLHAEVPSLPSLLARRSPASVGIAHRVIRGDEEI